MPSFEGLVIVLMLLAAAGGALALFAVLRRQGASPAVQALGRGHFQAALAAARTDRQAAKEDLLAAAAAAKHLLDWDTARTLLRRVLAADPGDGEAWLESGLVATYSGDFAAAGEAFARAEALRSDLAESLTLHRAFLALRRGDRHTARRLFEEIEAPLETKLRTDLGGGEPLFAEWFLQASALWAAAGDTARAGWARREGRAAAPESRLEEISLPPSAPPPVQ
jgi:tetratricopeptide (TPR) repeat protein